MKERISKILFYVIVLIIQIIISDNINTGPYIYICCIPLLIIYLPLNQNTIVSMLLAFGIGLMLDILSDGVMGLNAGASVLLCLFRKPLFYLVFNKENYDKTEIPSVNEAGSGKYIRYVSISVLLFLLFYMGFDGFQIRTWTFIIVRILLSCIVNIAIIMLISYSLLNTNRRT